MYLEVSGRRVNLNKNSYFHSKFILKYVRIATLDTYWQGCTAACVDY